ncbi:MAG: CHRD domain-containing protein [Gammaproteobacteria bacterium]
MNRLFGSRTFMGFFCLPALAVVGLAHADDRQFKATLSGAQEAVFDAEEMFVPGGTGSAATGRVNARFDRAFTGVRVNLTVNGLTGTFAAAHFHCGRPGQNGPVVFGFVNPGPLEFDGRRIRGALTSADFTGADCLEFVGRPVNNIVALAFAMRDGLIYANVHSDVFPDGEIRGQMLARDDDEGDDG